MVTRRLFHRLHVGTCHIHGVLKVGRYEDSSFNFTCQNPFLTSNLVNSLAKCRRVASHLLYCRQRVMFPLYRIVKVFGINTQSYFSIWLGCGYHRAYPRSWRCYWSDDILTLTVFSVCYGEQPVLCTVGVAQANLFHRPSCGIFLTAVRSDLLSENSGKRRSMSALVRQSLVFAFLYYGKPKRSDWTSNTYCTFLAFCLSFLS